MNTHVALFLPSLRGGGAERVMATLAREFCAQGIQVDVVVAKAEGPYLFELPDSVRVIDLGVSRVAFGLFGLIRYLRRERPMAMLATMNHANVVALIARCLSFSSTRLVVREAVNLSANINGHSKLTDKVMPFLVGLFYPTADSVIAVSRGVAEDLVGVANIQKEKVLVIYNPVDLNELHAKSSISISHPWFQKGEPPVILAVGRLVPQKDFGTLIKAFFLITQQRKIALRLMILGEGEERPKLEEQIRNYGLKKEILLPGFVDNPYPYMKQAAVFVLSSLWEGLPNVLIQAMALGTPVVSTNCPSGPEEILEFGKWGALVPVASPKVMSEAIVSVLEKERENGTPYLRDYCEKKFGVKPVSEAYLRVMLAMHGRL